VLNTFEDSTLEAILKPIEVAKTLTGELKASRTENAKLKEAKGKNAEEEEEEEEVGEKSSKGKMPEQFKKNKKKVEAKNAEPEFVLSDLPVELQETIAYAQTIENARKTELIDCLVENLEDDDKAEAITDYEKTTVANLEKLAKRYGVKAKTVENEEGYHYPLNFSGQMVGNKSGDKAPTPLGVPSWDF
jgi:hypothetical protein